jgi:Domain of unknown function (DUF4307)
VPTPFTRDQLSPAMQERYGLAGRPLGRRIAVTLILAAFVGALVFVTFGLTCNPVQSRLIAWDDVAADRVDMTIQVRRLEADEVTCVLRAQDVNRIDVGYAEVVIPAGEPQLLLDYALRTIAPAYTAELLGCAVGGPPAVPPPQFPPGVVPPAQPY